MKEEKRMGEGKKIKVGAHPVDLFVGRRLRVLRQSRSMSQEKMAFRVGLTFQQIQKYEKGLNRISCSKLYEFARLLNVRVQDFFDGFVWQEEGGGDMMADSMGEAGYVAGGVIDYGSYGVGYGGESIGGVSERELEKIVSAVVSSEEEQIKDKVTKVLRVLGKLGNKSNQGQQYGVNIGGINIGGSMAAASSNSGEIEADEESATVEK